MTEIRKGKLIVLDDEPYQVMSSEYLRKQQRRPVMRTTLRNIRTGATKQHSFQQSDKVTEADVGRLPHQFLYIDGNTYMFMDQESYEQVELSEDIVGDAVPYLIESQAVDLVLYDGEPIGIELPIKVDRKVVEAPPGVKGDTSSNVMKEVVVEGGLKVKAPLFTKAGDSIRIDTRSGVYVERA